MAGVVTMIMGLWLALPAFAAPVTLFTTGDFYIPRPAANSDQVGVRRLLLTFDLAANGFGDLIGEDCLFTVAAFNGDSVHLDNYAVITTGGNETDVYGTESLPNVETTTLEDATHILGPTIEFYNVMEVDPNGTVGTSVDFVVTVDCEYNVVTTTTVADSTTTLPTTPTTGQVTTTTEQITTTTEQITTTTGQVTTTTGPDVEVTTTVPSVTGSTLPFTGPPVEAAGLAMAAAGLLMLGSGVVTAIRER
jgi:hypothetical protein